jgi:hypothetical protein
MQTDGWMDGWRNRPDEAKKRCNNNEVGIRGAGLWKFCSLAEVDRSHTMLIRSSRQGIRPHNIKNINQLLYYEEYTVLELCNSIFPSS